MVCLCKLEYYTNVRGLLKYFYVFILGRLKEKTEIDLYVNDSGASITHVAWKSGNQYECLVMRVL